MIGKSLYDLLYAHFKFEVTRKQYLAYEKVVTAYEVKNEHSAALGSPLLGIHKMHFLGIDEQALFAVFGVDLLEFKKVSRTANSVNSSFVVSSAPYNIFTMWAIHRTLKSNMSAGDKDTMCLLLVKMLHYRFMTSVVNYQLSYGADEGVMQYTIDNLNNKFLIKTVGSWKGVIEQRSLDVMDPKGIHIDTFKSFKTDDDVLYAITDIQTRIRKQLVTVIQLYYKNKEAGRSVDSISVMENIKGDLSLRVIEAGIGDMANAVANTVTNLSEFIDYTYVDVAVKLNKEITSDLLMRVLSKFSEMAELQEKSGDSELITGSGSHKVLTGYKVLVYNILQKTYRQCMLDQDVDANSKVAIINKARAIYRSSRINDPDILLIKDSTDAFISKYSKSKRDNTNISLRSAFIVYILLLSFRQMK
jgi:hypothetical protein